MIDSLTKTTHIKGEIIWPKEIKLLLNVHCEKDIATFLDFHAHPLHPHKVDRTGDIVFMPEEGKQKPREGSDLPRNTEHPAHCCAITCPTLAILWAMQPVHAFSGHPRPDWQGRGWGEPQPTGNMPHLPLAGGRVGHRSGQGEGAFL